MTPEHQRKTLADWHFPQFSTFWEKDGTLRHQYPNERTGPAFNYPEDLNSVALLESKLDALDHKHFTWMLFQVLNGFKHFSPDAYDYAREILEMDLTIALVSKVLRATAAQKCEAILRVIGKWEGK